MLLSLILIVWLAALVLALALWRMAARGDAAPAPIADSPRRSTDGGLVVRDDAFEVALHDERTAAGQRLTAHGARRHREPSAAGS